MRSSHNNGNFICFIVKLKIWRRTDEEIFLMYAIFWMQQSAISNFESETIYSSSIDFLCLLRNHQFFVHFSSFEFWFHMITLRIQKIHFPIQWPMTRIFIRIQIRFPAEENAFRWLWFAHAYSALHSFSHSWYKVCSVFCVNWIHCCVCVTVVSIMLSIVSSWTGSRNGKRWVVKFLGSWWRYTNDVTYSKCMCFVEIANDHFHFVSVVFFKVSSNDAIFQIH